MTDIISMIPFNCNIKYISVRFDCRYKGLQCYVPSEIQIVVEIYARFTPFKGA